MLFVLFDASLVLHHPGDEIQGHPHFLALGRFASASILKAAYILPLSLFRYRSKRAPRPPKNVAAAVVRHLRFCLYRHAILFLQHRVLTGAFFFLFSIEGRLLPGYSASGLLSYRRVS